MTFPLSRDWTTYLNKPADNDNLNLGAAEIRATKVDVGQRMGIDHQCGVSVNVDGTHLHSQYLPSATDPTLIATYGCVYTKVVSGVTELFYEDSAAAVTQLTSGGVIKVTSTITGEIRLWPTAVAPSGWVLCDGTSYSAAAQPALFAVIGYTYGGSSGNFNVPDFRGNTPVGYKTGDSDFGALGNTAGEKTHTLITAEMPSHTHTFSYSLGATGATTDSTSGASNSGNRTTSSTGGDGAHNNLQPSLTVNFIIKT
jgi:microcystin-dependent protein